MVGALIYLRLTSLRNLLLARIRRLRQPKYLGGAIVGAAYFYFVIFGQGGARRSAPTHAIPPDTIAPELLPTLTAIGALLMMVIIVASWIVPDQRAGIAFSEAEIAFLFPAPLRRRTLVLYKLVNSQFKVFLTVALLSLFMVKWRHLGGNVFTHAAGWWVILATMNLHFMGSSFAVTRLLDRGITPLRRRLIILGGLIVTAFVAVIWIGRGLHALAPADYANATSLLSYANRMLTSGPLPWLLWPAKLVVAPFLAPTTREFFAAFWPALLVFAAHFWWVMHAEVSFEDASIAKSEKRAARIAAIREGNWRAARGAMKARREPFRLRARGRPEIAFLWKNLLSTYPIFRPRIFATVVIIIVAVHQGLEQNREYRAFMPLMAGVALMVSVYTVFIGPQLARQDLRSDLSNADMLKSYPLHGWQVVLGQMLTPVAILTGLLWLGLLAIGLSYHPPRYEWLTPALRLTVIAALVVITPVVCALQLTVPNAAAIFFPAWVQSMRNRSERGVEVLGQRLIFVAGQLLVVITALTPGVAAAFAVFFSTQWLIGPVAAAAVAGGAVFVVLFTEVVLGIWWLGERFERFDLSAELRA